MVSRSKTLKDQAFEALNKYGQGNLSGTGVMIYNSPQSTSDNINIAGSGTITLSPQLTGPYQGVLLFQNRTATAPVSVSGSGSGTMTLSGVFYAAAAVLSVTGNGTQDVLGAQYISYDVVLGGNGHFNVNWDPNTTPGKREIFLVE